MLEEVYKTLKAEDDKAIEAFIGHLAKLRTGRANPAILEDIIVDYYNTPTPLKQMASISVAEGRMLVIQPWDVSAIGEVEKAIRSSDLGLNPQNQGKILRIVIPEMTEERRKDMTKMVGKMNEENKISLRQHRKNAIDTLKAKEKDKEITEDELHKGQDKVQEITNEYTKQSDDIAKAKEKEIMEF